jgi:GDP-4-dehydro-6-deoxy-D-mannose reductase
VRALITGYGGFAGGHLADHLLSLPGWMVWGTVLRPDALPEWHHPAVEALPADLREPAAVRRVLAAAQPEVIFHLAGQTFVPQAWQDPWDTFETNVRMQLNLLQALRDPSEHGGRPIRMIAVTTNEVYGAVPVEAPPADERTPLAPVNPYAISKAAQDGLAGAYARALGLDVVRVRPFNHIGPRQDDRFVAANFARQLAEIEAGLRLPVLRVGDLSTERDFSDVRDIVRGYRLAAEHGRAGEVYNLGSGRARSVRELLESFLGLVDQPVGVETDPARLRPAEIPRMWCDAGKARRELGWAPRVPFEQSLADVLDDWRARVHRGRRTGAAEPVAPQ